MYFQVWSLLKLNDIHSSKLIIFTSEKLIGTWDASENNQDPCPCLCDQEI